MKKYIEITVMIVYAVIYGAAMAFFLTGENVSEETFMIMFMSHALTFAAILFRKSSVRKRDILKTFVYLVVAVTIISKLPISGTWAIIPFWICGFFHTLKISHKSLMGHLYGAEEKPTRDEIARDLLIIWAMMSGVVTLVIL